MNYLLCICMSMDNMLRNVTYFKRSDHPKWTKTLDLSEVSHLDLSEVSVLARESLWDGPGSWIKTDSIRKPRTSAWVTGFKFRISWVKS